MEWIRVKDQAPGEARIMVLSRKSRKIHIVHFTYYEKWCLDEIDTGSDGEIIQFDWWMRLPGMPME